MIWVLESNVFPKSHTELRKAIAALGHQIIDWHDDWLPTEWPRLRDSAVVFHGSLGNAARIQSSVSWRPGAYCNVSLFHCTAWYPNAGKWLLNRDWRVLPLCDFVANPDQVLAELGQPASVFVRPDSPLKPFSGRRLNREQISLAALDHGFYYDDISLPVIVAPVRDVGREWRYVIVDHRVVAGSGYAADGRVAIADDPHGSPRRFADAIAKLLPPPEAVYILDICEENGELWLLELNPFSGADLYACQARDVVAAVSEVASKMEAESE